MKKYIILLLLNQLFGLLLIAQNSCIPNDTIANNLVHAKNYKTGVLGAIPTYKKYGKGKQSMILVPGLGFDYSIFKDFMVANRSNYTMYAITISGFGNTSAPPMPDASVSYGEQTWTKGVIDGISKLIIKENIQNPIIVGHFTLGSQIALRMAIDNPDKFSGAIILGGQAKFIAIQCNKVLDYPLKFLIQGTDKYSAPILFKGKSEKDWDEGNYLPEIYSLNKKRGKKLWNIVASVPVPVMVRYLCEFTSTDLKAELSKIKCPVLVLRPMFNDGILKTDINSYVRPQFIDTWNNATLINQQIQIKDVSNSATFVWKDSSRLIYEEIRTFISSLK